MTKQEMLEKRCIRRTFPEVADTPCNKPCRGYDKFCEGYTPTGTFNFAEIEAKLDWADYRKTQTPPQ